MIRDVYKLQASHPFSLAPREEEDVHLNLTKASADIHTLLSGKVTTQCGDPVVGATVKVFSYDLKPLYHTLTDDEGSYSFVNIIPSGKYKVAAVAEDYMLSDIKVAWIRTKMPIFIRFTLQPTPFTAGIVYGKIIEQRTNLPVSNSKVKLLLSNQTMCAETMSNEDGEYLFYQVPSGEYVVFSKRDGYQQSDFVPLKVYSNERIQIRLYMKPKPIFELGTISGMITVENCPTANIPVFLYRVHNGTEELIQTQITQVNGLYLFSAVESGEYIVKAKLQNGKLYKQESYIDIG
ncbi:carboxypeptidase regulatory-like domain-containing protein [Aneurinibacillus aneurinilyticus]|uniref:MSCRAMM family protein n=1 Tax=Aneurinibacillus aneurinilyticus TaxID=1391 RepID=UPI002E245C2B|nr:carboxypeptidase regulatory-like domain-containing protein [Aneurinibacillus aneurinilyticus]